MHYELIFKYDETERKTNIYVVVDEKPVLTGHVIHGDTSAERWCSVTVQRPFLVRQSMVDGLRQALIALTGQPSMVDGSLEQIKAA